MFKINVLISIQYYSLPLLKRCNCTNGVLWIDFSKYYPKISPSQYSVDVIDSVHTL